MSIVEHIGKHYISRTILIVYQIRRIHQKKITKTSFEICSKSSYILTLFEYLLSRQILYCSTPVHHIPVQSQTQLIYVFRLRPASWSNTIYNHRNTTHSWSNRNHQAHHTVSRASADPHKSDPAAWRDGTARRLAYQRVATSHNLPQNRTGPVHSPPPAAPAQAPRAGTPSPLSGTSERQGPGFLGKIRVMSIIDRAHHAVLDSHQAYTVRSLSHGKW